MIKKIIQGEISTPINMDYQLVGYYKILSVNGSDIIEIGEIAANIIDTMNFSSKQLTEFGVACENYRNGQGQFPSFCYMSGKPTLTFRKNF